MLLLLGKPEAIRKYIKEMLPDIDEYSDVVYYPGKEHYYPICPVVIYYTFYTMVLLTACRKMSYALFSIASQPVEVCSFLYY